MQKITPCLWFDNQAEEAARFYTSIFKNSKINTPALYGTEGQEITGQKPGSVMTVDFELDGQKFLALNGGPLFKFSEAVSMIIDCDDQKEVDYYWDALIANGGSPSQCGWLKDKFGFSWQVVPKALGKLMSDPDQKKSQRVMHAMFQMKKLDVAELQRAYDQE